MNLSLEINNRTDAEIDKQLMSRIASGDREALSSLYDRYASRLGGIAYHILHNRQDAEDLLHDAFIEFWRRAGSYNPQRGSVIAWLTMQLRCRAIDRQRMLATLYKKRLVQPPEEQPSKSEQQKLESDADKALVNQALATLSERQRNVVELGYFRGLSYQEIARQCDLPLGTVKSRLAAAIDKLRKYFSQMTEAV